jgi:hypothetical protein
MPSTRPDDDEPLARVAADEDLLATFAQAEADSQLEDHAFLAWIAARHVDYSRAALPGRATPARSIRPLTGRTTLSRRGKCWRTCILAGISERRATDRQIGSSQPRHEPGGSSPRGHEAHCPDGIRGRLVGGFPLALPLRSSSLAAGARPAHAGIAPPS